MNQAELAKSVASAAGQAENLAADAEKLNFDAEGLGESVAKLQTDLATYAADLKTAKAEREKEHADYLEQVKDYGESVDALDRAIQVLQEQNYDRAGSAALLQSKGGPSKSDAAAAQAQAKSALLQVAEKEGLPQKARDMAAQFAVMLSTDDPDFASYAAPQANAYEFQSGSVIDMLKRLKGEFEEKKAEDEKELEDSKIECADKGRSFQEKQALRAEEIAALEKAVEILRDPAVSGAAAQHLGLAQVASKASTALLQIQSLGADAAGDRGIRSKVREFLANAGKRLRSKRLGLLAAKIEADPFAKVKVLISDMITRLLEEANTDASHEGFCDKEVGESKNTRNKLAGEIDSLDAAVEQGKALIVEP